ncbi:MAG: DUF3800 domain-containing protein [Proteobacteria bacterium]|nr:DUF3800 domain-containing protein [Desulfobacteraceae bacterium]MBU3980208.1 DUF3800 domain-containing protein [Pseudomonadota bacterium]MBU4013613.1 DUF3800 domain-containing protein [Pseudomonadota bacterium]MBU4067388.1 DUF3800 domain-containing protein [Pseudomonadota bacterium]MBU4127198.1 DUF3800 domain-containing protein [Pseudomonadota bacterium]
MPKKGERKLTRCYVDESVQSKDGFVITAFVLTNGFFNRQVARVLESEGLVPGKDEFKSSHRMDDNPTMRTVRQRILALAGEKTRVSVFIGPYDRRTIGKHSLQALQSTLIRNGVPPYHLNVYFDQDIFPSVREATRLHKIFHFLRSARIYPKEDSRLNPGIQVADCIAHSFGQIVKEELTGKRKMIDIGGPDTGYSKGTEASLGWHLLMTLRHSLMTRPMVYNGERYSIAPDPLILDPVADDPVNYGQNPILLGWGVQVAPEAGANLRLCVERALGKIWLGCIH